MEKSHRGAILLLALVSLASLVSASEQQSSAQPGGLANQESEAARRTAFPPPAAFDVRAFDVRAFGARGDGKTLDTAAINRAVLAAAAAGGGTVYFPAGTYPSHSIRLKSHVTLHLGPGATLLAAEPGSGEARYDLPEPNEWDLYQDFGHSHWQNSLIWGIGLENVAIVGPGRIDGSGLTRRGPGARWTLKAGDRPLSMVGATGGREDPEAAGLRAMEGQGNKAIALKLCRNVLLRDLTIRNGGHFAVLATGVDDLTIDNLSIDTNRDGLDIDSCRNVRISNTSVNSPNDDAIVLKSSFALGFARATENVTIGNCQVTGYDLGTLLDGSVKRTLEHAPDRDGPTGRVKLGTESNGGFRNIAISNCVFDRSRGLALETVDGGVVEDVAITNVTMRDVTTAPIFMRIGQRGRGPGTPPVGAMRRVTISNVVAYDVEPRFASIIAGLPGHPVEDVTISNVRIVYRGGGTREDAAREVPEHETAYPEPSMFGTLPAYGLFVRHARGVTLRDVDVSFASDEWRPPFLLHDVAGASLSGLRARARSGVPALVLRDVSDLTLRDSLGLADLRRERVERETLASAWAPPQAPSAASAAPSPSASPSPAYRSDPVDTAHGDREFLLLWPEGAPAAAGSEPADKPKITLYKAAADKANGASVIVCPGGGYVRLASNHEGKQVAEWLNGLGVSAFVLQYRVGPRYRHPAPLQDVKRAIRLVRSKAGEWGLDAARVGVLGFSAGGHLVSTAGTHFDDGRPDARDPVERIGSRPDFLILGYPVIAMTGPFVHKGSVASLLGDTPAPGLAEELSSEKRVTARTPPAFLFHTTDDATVPVENSVSFYSALRAAGVPAELHVFRKGRHGVGLAPDDPVLSAWPKLCAAWLESMGFLVKK